ncbi:Glycosyl transferase [Aphelenchoides avenae]|nr:Glycosyl transferase [Aphelenchus avenae]
MKILPIASSIEGLDKNQRYIVSNFTYSPGLGNLMFQYAALRVFAERYDAKLILPSDCLLRRAFGNLTRVILMAPSAVNRYIEQHPGKELKTCCDFHPNLELFGDGRKIEVLTGYFQSFRYFHPEHAEIVRNEFRFLTGVQEMASRNIEDVKFERMKVELDWDDDKDPEHPNDGAMAVPEDFDDDYLFVGMHVRHGMDVTWNERNLKHGHVTAPPEYFFRAMERFRLRYAARKLIFVVASDDIEWAKKSITDEKGEVAFLDSKYREVDSATLAMCNHTIMSVGTFSWWAAYLTDGEAVRYAGWPRPGSELATMVKTDDYFLSQWTAIN